MTMFIELDGMCSVIRIVMVICIVMVISIFRMEYNNCDVHGML